MRIYLYIIVTVLAAAIQACTPLERDLSRAQVVGWDKRAKSRGQDSGKEKGKTRTYQIWTALVEYPESYDWRLNAEWRSVESKIHLLCDGEEQLCFSAGPKGMGDAENNIIRTEGDKCVVIDGLKNYIVVDRDDVLLIYPKAKEQNIKEIVNEVKNKWGLH